MSFTGKDPKFNSESLTDIVAGTPANPAAGSNKVVNRNGFLFSRDSAGAETAVTPEVTQSASGLVLSAGQLLGTNTSDDAADGYVGQTLMSFLAGHVFTTFTVENITSLDFNTILPGDFDVSLSATFHRSGATFVTVFSAVAGLSPNAGAIDNSFSNNTVVYSTPTVLMNDVSLALPMARVTWDGTTLIVNGTLSGGGGLLYAVATLGTWSGAPTADVGLIARRRR